MAKYVHETLCLHSTAEKFYVEPLDQGGSSKELLVIDRVTQEISLEDYHHEQIPASADRKQIFGILGVLRLLAGPYLIVVTKRSTVGTVCNALLWKVEETELISYKRNTRHMSESQVKINDVYLSMINSVLNFDHFYFSITYDITHTMQRLYNTSPEFIHMALYERADQRFVWNGHLIRELATQPELHRFILPIMCGFITLKSAVINNETFKFSVISRRACYRAGTRYYMRGLDGEGHVANYVETEQIVEHNSTKCSFVQTRGSIPVYWTQRPNLLYKPVAQVNLNNDHVNAFRRHFDSQIYCYGKQTIINLVNQKGGEKALEEAYRDAVFKSNNSDIRYESFDFHHQCRYMRWDRLDILIDRLSNDFTSYGYFMMMGDGSAPHSVQTGVFRTNCIDCLDRTNVVQSMLALRAIEKQLQEMSVLNHGEKLIDHPQFEHVYKNVWADNGDQCSIQYAGTPALKSDFTRSGKRTLQGALADGYKSMVRYHKNNFSDGTRQDAIDLFLGNYVVDEAETVTKPSPLQQTQDVKYVALPVIMIVAFSMCIVCVLIPPDTWTLQLLYVLFWGAATVISASVIIYNGREFVDKPRLAQKTKSD